MEEVKTMIHDQDLPMHLWDEAARKYEYVQNILSQSSIGFKTPEEMDTGKKHEVSHLKKFGCPVYVHIPKEKRTKLHPSVNMPKSRGNQPTPTILNKMVLWKERT